MVIPKINFTYSWIYDKIWQGVSKKHKIKYPSFREIQNYTKKVEKIWKKDRKKVLTELSSITKLNWKEKEVKCYIVGYCVPFSDPLTIPIYLKYPNYFIDVLVHELIHQLFIQNQYKTQKYFDYLIKRKYKNHDLITAIHVPVHAVHKHIYLKIYNTKRLERDILLIKKVSPYKKSWEIVNNEGYQNIINELVSKTTKNFK